MKIIINYGEESHTTSSTFYVLWGYEIIKNKKYTNCVISENGITVSVGVAICAKTDTFIKEKGRKLSLKHAIANFHKDIRTQFWKSYFNRKIKQS